jgi:predicted MFS family arabinose efflux permease
VLAGVLVSKERRGRALAIVNGGFSVAVALGVPKEAGTGLSSATLRERVAAIRQPSALPALFVTTLSGVGGYTVYTYIARLPE